VNDAPALKKASIGIAMGKAGTEVARQASSIVLTDDNFSTIVSAVEEGRAIFGNIKRTIQYLLSTNLAEILIMLGSAMLGFPMPLGPLNLLWINLVTDGPPSLALAAEPVAKDYLKSSPGPSPKSFFDKRFMTELFIVAIIMTAITIYSYYYGIKNSDLLTAKSYVFSLLVYLCLFRSFSCRNASKSYFELPFNPWHFASVIVPVTLQLGMQYTVFFQELFKVRSLSLAENAILLLLGLIPVTVVEIEKHWRRK
jgi:Ca2+-transporting ATPase